MSLHIDIEKDTLYKKGNEKGFEKGFEKGIEKGIEIMKNEIDAKDRLFVTYLLQTFQLDDASIAATAAVTSDFVKKIRKELEL